MVLAYHIGERKGLTAGIHVGLYRTAGIHVNVQVLHDVAGSTLVQKIKACTNHHWRRLVKNIGGTKIFGVVITDESIGISQLLRGMCLGCPQSLRLSKLIQHPI